MGRAYMSVDRNFRVTIHEGNETMPEYRFDMGNSSVGEVGYVAYVKAETPELAAEKLCKWTPMELLAEVEDDELGIRAMVFVNPDHITADRAELVEE